ncbi:hypothetical protein R3P38DRAFT_186388 [Favolaschia claudopus]|uniref:Uncharacterized protein n=1 Tax=Favolaschia claudopus TaxID=2862362 RepID=A0AAW0CYL5_9AGAR
MLGTSTRLISALIREELQDLLIIFSIMAMEAVFIQIPSARVHARNYIAPFVDSITSILAARFVLDSLKRSSGSTSSMTNSQASFRSIKFPLEQLDPPADSDDRPGDCEKGDDSSVIAIQRNALLNSARLPPPLWPPEDTFDFDNPRNDNDTFPADWLALGAPGAAHLRNTILRYKPVISMGSDTKSSPFDDSWVPPKFQAEP